MPLFRKTVLLALSLAFAAQAMAQQLPVPPTLAAKSWLLLEMASNQVLTSEKSDERLEPASLTKLMTAYLTFAALHNKTLALDQSLPVSEKAWRTGGSKMFIRVDTQVPVEDLIKGMIVQSGNDACVTLAEGIAGSEENFTQMMNREAQRLGMNASSFRNSTGLPDPEHYTTARDLSLLAAALIRDFPEEYKKYYSMKEYTYNNITQPNRNRLLYIDPSVDGVKTGHTEAAGYCLISSALRDKRRLLSVVLGTDSDSARASESQKLLNWGYISYDAVTVQAKDQAVAMVRAWKGAQSEAKAGFPSDLSIAVPKGYADKVKSEFVAEPRIIAPVEAGQKLGMLKVSIDGKVYGEYPVVALENVPLGNIFIRILDTIRLWFN
ncbi:MAG: D-alanyl-D-alanine carboxypeptidase [Gammaproteobacteria bacterium]|nr:D-alanyl-D-alanine carboxypeptidase [Gammaproteobacteria bacterium]MBU1603599.1 D-alanyl-D-alanine carboxypeptidase [Gammaproteobacteria bacterium]MBU2432396.1 D-alanyl-D-alanine carboxypeptidase [Gammaproteobacteria bacterium]MBU2447738.1 D-alanyl-D-alanine carboxypeptidase [Gammaproteobacteria bacterium]